MSGVIKWDLDAWEDYIFWQTADKGNLRRIKQLIRDISREPFEDIGKPEPLKGSLSGFGAAESIKSTDLFMWLREKIY